jgi:hypothetical protein
MKLFLFAALCFSFSAFGQIPVPDDWKLSARQARGMIQYYLDCRGTCPTSKAMPDSAKEDRIRTLFPHAKSMEWVNARYREDDVARYASRNWQVVSRGGAEVAGYTTRILHVVDEDGSSHYFDIATICPPPAICDARSESQ